MIRLAIGTASTPILAMLVVLARFSAAPAVSAAPDYWVDNEWIRVTGEETRQEGGRTFLAILAECKQQGFPEFIMTHLDERGETLAVEKSGKYCPRGATTITFLLALPASGTWRVEFHRIEGAM